MADMWLAGLESLVLELSSVLDQGNVGSESGVLVASELGDGDVREHRKSLDIKIILCECISQLTLHDTDVR